MTTTSPAPRPRRDASSRTDRPTSRSRRLRWRRIPGRLILAVCFAAAAVGLAAMVIPFTTVNDEGVELRCGPAVFEVLMPADPNFDDTAENVGCADPAATRLLVGGGVLLGALIVAGITERRTRRGSVRRDTRWLATSSATASRRRRSRRSPPPAGGRPAPDQASLPSSRP